MATKRLRGKVFFNLILQSRRDAKFFLPQIKGLNGFIELPPALAKFVVVWLKPLNLIISPSS